MNGYYGGMYVCILIRRYQSIVPIIRMENVRTFSVSRASGSARVRGILPPTFAALTRSSVLLHSARYTNTGSMPGCVLFVLFIDLGTQE
jgi:hypothetical protein